MNQNYAGKKLTGKVAIVTGASRLKGIGAAICESLAKEGADIFFTYWTKYDKNMPWGIHLDEPDLLQKKILDYGVQCQKLELDLSEASAPITLLDHVYKIFTSPSILINNATCSINADYEDFNASLLDKHYEINVRATALLSTEFARRFSKGSGGRIINLTSGQSLSPMINEIPYAITKGAIDIFTTTLSAAVASKGITVNAVNPGPTDTGWMNEEIKKNIVSRSPFGRIGVPEDAAKLITFLASEDAAWITGQIIHSDGGFDRL